MTDEGQGAITQQVDGGLVAGQQQQRTVHQHLMPGEDPAFLAAGHHGHEIVPGIVDALCDQRGQVLEHALHAGSLGPQPVGGSLAPGQELLGQLPDVGPVLCGNAHHLRDHQHGQGRGKVCHHIHAPFGLCSVQELCDSSLHHGAPGLHGSGGKIPMDDLTHLQMLRAIVLDELVRRETPDILVQSQVGCIDLRVRRPGIPFKHF